MLTTATTTAQPVQSTTREAVERVEKPAPESRQQAAPERRAKSAPSPERASQYRLVYDNDQNRTFIQIVNRESGEEIFRFPPEALVQFINDSLDDDPIGSTPGLLFDRYA